MSTLLRRSSAVPTTLHQAQVTSLLTAHSATKPTPPKPWPRFARNQSATQTP